MASHFKRKASEGQIKKYMISDSSHSLALSSKPTRRNTLSQILDRNISLNQMTWIKQIPERICYGIGTRFRELSFKFGDTKLVQKIFPAQFAIEPPIAEANEWIGDTFIGDDSTIVKLQVYQLRDSKLGFYHTGLEFRGLEYTFCANVGICHHTPKRCSFAKHLGVIALGTITMLEEEFKEIIKDMESNGKFSSSDYDVMDRSCNTFTAVLSDRLGLGSKYPQAIQSQSQLGQILAPVIHALDVVAEHSGCANIAEMSEAISGQSVEGSVSLSQSKQAKIQRSNSNHQMSLQSNSSFSSLASTFTKTVLKRSSSSNLPSPIPILHSQKAINGSPKHLEYRKTQLNDDSLIFDDLTTITVHKRSGLSKSSIFY